MLIFGHLMFTMAFKDYKQLKLNTVASKFYILEKEKILKSSSNEGSTPRFMRTPSANDLPELPRYGELSKIYFADIRHKKGLG